MLLTDDNQTKLDAVSQILHNNFEIVGAVGEGHSLIEAVTRLDPLQRI